MFDIENCPAEAWNYEFIVCEIRDDKLVYNGCCRSAYNAEEMARGLNYGVVVHNVRIQGYKDPHRENLYTFYGTWSWSCWAKSKKEAIQKYEDEAYPEELCIDPYDHIEETEDE